jgi:hypothetical protein
LFYFNKPKEKKEEKDKSWNKKIIEYLKRLFTKKEKKRKITFLTII